jgi:hypothetical protein
MWVKDRRAEEGGTKRSARAGRFVYFRGLSGVFAGFTC